MKLRNKHCTTLGIVSLTSVFTFPLYAQSADPEDPVFETIIVTTAGRREQPIADVQASIQVFSREMIESFSGASLTEILRQAVGVDARTSGANSTVAVRGQIPNAGSSVLILVDGLPRTGAFGLANLNNFPVEDVERIEVIRGPMSSLYGANAAGGVINVITRAAGDGSPLSVNLLAGVTDSDAGNGRETMRVNGSVNLQQGNTGHRVSVDYRDADSFKFHGTGMEDDLFSIDHLSLTYNGMYSSSPSNQLSWAFEFYDQDDQGNAISRTNVPFTRFEREERRFGALQWEGDIGDGSLVLEGSIGTSDAVANRSFPGPDEFTDYTQIMLQGRYYLDIGDHSLLFSAGQQQDEIDLSILTGSGELTNTFAFIQDQWNISDNMKLILGLRQDDFDSYGAQTTPRVTLGSREDGVTWRVGYGEAFRAPSVLEQFARFNRGRFLIVGDPDIAPEDSETYEVAIGWRDHSGYVELVYHESKIDNLIQAAPNGERINDLLVFQYQNIAKAEISGFELTGQYNFGYGLSINGSYETLDAEDRSSGSRLNGRADQTIRLSLNYTLDRFSATLRSRHTLGLYGIDPADRGRPAFESEFNIIDAQFNYEFSDSLQINLGIDNLADKQVPVNWSTTGQIEDPAGRFTYLGLQFQL